GREPGRRSSSGQAGRRQRCDAWSSQTARFDGRINLRTSLARGRCQMKARTLAWLGLSWIVAAAPLVAQGGGRETAVFAGGCFWGVDAVFRHVRGVLQVVSGYAGGDAATARYELVSTSTTGHAESVEVTYDAATVSYAQLLRVFFTVAHDPTQRD